jgi:hypothetical protein
MGEESIPWEAVTEAERDPDEVVLVLAHPFGDVETTLAEWMRTGPGPRPLVRPVAARSRRTGEPLPLTVVPLPYRNDKEARARIAAGDIEWPWSSGDPA